ncbi:MAG TPA: hypothetical protein VII11_02610, partial [Bacteroidota bacterium]
MSLYNKLFCHTACTANFSSPIATGSDMNVALQQIILSCCLYCELQFAGSGGERHECRSTKIISYQLAGERGRP